MNNKASIRGVIYDMDGTLTRPYFKWEKLRADMKVPQGELILEHLNTLSEDGRKQKEAILLAYEQEAAQNSELNPGVRETMQEMRNRGIIQAVATNNSSTSAGTVLSMHGIEVDVLVTREDGVPKPAGSLLSIAMEHMGCSSEEVVYIGDSMHDVRAAQNAGVRFILLASNPNPPECPTTIHSFSELIELI